VAPVTTKPEPYKVFPPLFRAAQEADEFEYCCALLRIRGMEAAGWDPTEESLALMHQVVSLIQAPLDRQLVFRLSLFLYSHATEMADIYNVPMNMLRITAGERYSMEPFGQLPKLPKAPTGDPLNECVRHLVQHARNAGWSDVADLYEFFFVRQVRNAFFHSDYALGSTSFNIKHGEYAKVGGMLQRAIPYDWLTPKLEVGINTALALLSLLAEAARAYTTNKIVHGRLGHGSTIIPIELTADPEHGLTGFRSPPYAASAGDSGS
jgi:hypothetical protein